jgi:hypothetical protein
VRQFARHKFSLERQRQAVAGYARPKWVMKAIAHAIEMAAEGACLRSWEGESISRAGIPISLATEPFSLLVREPRLPQQYQCQRLVVGYIKRLAGRVVQEGQKFVFPVGHGSGWVSLKLARDRARWFAWAVALRRSPDLPPDSLLSFSSRASCPLLLPETVTRTSADVRQPDGPYNWPDFVTPDKTSKLFL